MLPLTRKLIAVLMALWLPLSSGSALAVSVAMQASGGQCAPVVQVDGYSAHHASAQDHSMHGEHDGHAMHAQSVAFASEPAEQQDSPCNNCGVCHLACCGYLAAVACGMLQSPLSDRTYTPSSTQFQSVALGLQDPPPLVRV